ncbi:NAD(P)/FAD-dependent oxidoreductase [Siccirubricoccus sp. G192]|uniref:NAD(P)/FAD-dependent oxidoreductase n=1 Tax=Siccirubricoccus sp. G192 TaxID=2849651 RepID=UPI0035C873CA
MSDPNSPDVAIIGGGPAGSTAAAMLAMAGRRVTLLEKSAHPRFHIGESLLPRNLDILERLGVLEEVRGIGVHKPGAESVSDRTGRSAAFPFAKALNRSRTHAWQVKRSEFDTLLFANARRRGATMLENTRVTDIRFGAVGERPTVLARDAAGAVLELRPRYLLDASGRDTFLAGRMRVKDSNKYNNTAATYAHFRGVERRGGELDGYISIHLAEDGWFWLIPLPGDIMSIGFVGNQSAWKGRKGSAAELFLARIAGSPTVAARSRGGGDRLRGLQHRQLQLPRPPGAWRRLPHDRRRLWLRRPDVLDRGAHGDDLRRTRRRGGRCLARRPGARPQAGGQDQPRAGPFHGADQLADLPRQRPGHAVAVHGAAQYALDARRHHQHARGQPVWRVARHRAGPGLQDGVPGAFGPAPDGPRPGHARGDAGRAAGRRSGGVTRPPGRRSIRRPDLAG